MIKAPTNASNSPIRHVPKARPLPELMEEALPYIQNHQYNPVLFPALLRSLTRYINAHNGTTSEHRKGGSQANPSPMVKRQGRRHSMQGSTPAPHAPHSVAPKKVVDEPAPPSAASAGKKPRQRRHSMISTVSSAVSGKPKKPQSEFDGYPLPPNKHTQRHHKEQQSKPEPSDGDDRPVVKASPMRRRRRHSISVTAAPQPKIQQQQQQQDAPASPCRTPRQQQDSRVPVSPRQLPQSPSLDGTLKITNAAVVTTPLGLENQYEDQMEVRVVRRKLEQARQNLAESQESFDRLKQSQEESHEQHLLSMSNDSADDSHLDMAILDKEMRRETQQIAKLEEELERLVKQARQQ